MWWDELTGTMTKKLLSGRIGFEPRLLGIPTDIDTQMDIGQLS